MLKIGLTGGIGSGKTTVSRIFESLGVPVYNADDNAKRLLASDNELKNRIIEIFGEASFKGDEPDRKYLAAIVFNDKNKLELLNAMVHPVTIKDAEAWMRKQTTPYVIKEAAILFESGASENLDYVIGVSAPQHIRVKRVMDRDNLSIDEVMKRITRQIDEDMKMKLCDFVITNNDLQLVIPQVLALHEKFSKGKKE